MFVSDNSWIKEAWKQEARKECNSIKDEIILKIQTKQILIEGEFKPKWKKVKNASKKVVRKKDLNRAWKEVRELTGNSQCRLCKEQ